MAAKGWFWPMLHDARFDMKGGKRTFAAIVNLMGVQSESGPSASSYKQFPSAVQRFA